MKVVVNKNWESKKNWYFSKASTTTHIISVRKTINSWLIYLEKLIRILIGNKFKM